MPLPLSSRHRLRPGGSWTRQAGDDPHALVTLVAFDRDEEPDDQGRRPGDVNVGSVKSAELAESFCIWYNGAQGRYQESLTGVPTRSDDGPVPRQPDEEAPVAPHAYQLTSPRRVQVDRELLAALLETSGCQAARESYQAHVDGDAALRAGAHPLAAEHACPSCDLARALGVPDRLATEGPGGEPREGDRVVYVGPERGSDWAERRNRPGLVLALSGYGNGDLRVWHSRGGGYRAALDHLRVVERATYTRVYEH